MHSALKKHSNAFGFGSHSWAQAVTGFNVTHRSVANRNSCVECCHSKFSAAGKIGGKKMRHVSFEGDGEEVPGDPVQSRKRWSPVEVPRCQYT